MCYIQSILHWYQGSMDGNKGSPASSRQRIARKPLRSMLRTRLSQIRWHHYHLDRFMCPYLTLNGNGSICMRHSLLNASGGLSTKLLLLRSASLFQALVLFLALCLAIGCSSRKQEQLHGSSSSSSFYNRYRVGTKQPKIRSCNM
jgi:hypothetical protein